jgi:2',3'-cyclic-nucleotide 2'-phosphodiesterase/3'-nucleotidase
VTTAPVLYNAQVEIRQLLIDWVTTNKVIDASTFSTVAGSWSPTVSP